MLNRNISERSHLSEKSHQWYKKFLPEILLHKFPTVGGEFFSCQISHFRLNRLLDNFESWAKDCLPKKVLLLKNLSPNMIDLQQSASNKSAPPIPVNAGHTFSMICLSSYAFSLSFLSFLPSIHLKAIIWGSD